MGWLKNILFSIRIGLVSSYLNSISVRLDKLLFHWKVSKKEIIIILTETHFPVESLLLCPNCIQRSNYGYQTLQLEHKVKNIEN